MTNEYSSGRRNIPVTHEGDAASSPIARLAQRAVGLDLAEISAELREHAAAVLADTIAVIAAGARQPEVQRLAASTDPMFPAPPAGPCAALVPGLLMTDPTTAAFINGTAGTWLELDEGIGPTGHPAVHVLPAALGAAQALHASGSALLVAFLSGYEVAARLLRAYQLRFPLHPHGHLGAVGAAVAVARLRGEDPGPAAQIAASLPLLTTWVPCFEGATVRNTYSGVAAAVGVFASKLATAGFTGSVGALDAAFGEMVGELVEPDLITELDVDRLLIADDYIKLHSACALSHTVIDAALAIGRVPVDEIERVEIETTARNLRLDQQAAGNSLSTRFSLSYAASAVLIHGHGGPEAFEPDERVYNLASRVEVCEGADFSDAWPTSSPARISVRLRGGERTAQVDNPIGYPASSVSPQTLLRKFESLTGPSNHPDRHYDYDRLLAVVDIADAADLFQP